MKVIFTVLVLFFAVSAYGNCNLNFTEPTEYVTGNPIQEGDKPLFYEVVYEGGNVQGGSTIEHGTPITCEEVGVPLFGDYEIYLITITQSGKRSVPSNTVTYSRSTPNPKQATDLSIELLPLSQD